MTRILIIDGHPDPQPGRYVHALSGAYEHAARAAGHEVRTITLACIDFPGLRDARDFLHGDPPPTIREAQQWLAWCEHVVILYPLWLGDMPALFYRWYYRAHSLKSLTRNILGFCGIGPVRSSMVGMVENQANRRRWLRRMEILGRQGR